MLYWFWLNSSNSSNFTNLIQYRENTSIWDNRGLSLMITGQMHTKASNEFKKCSVLFLQVFMCSSLIFNRDLSFSQCLPCDPLTLVCTCSQHLKDSCRPHGFYSTTFFFWGYDFKQWHLMGLKVITLPLLFIETNCFPWQYKVFIGNSNETNYRSLLVR